MASKGPLRLRFLPSMRQGVRILARRFRSQGMDEHGSVLAAGVVILGIFAVMLTAGVRHEGSAQELDIFTAHRREALDVARGGMDDLLMRFYASPGIDGAIDSHGYPAELSAQRNGNTVWLTSAATVSGVSETVRIELRREQQNAFENFLGGITIAARKDITGGVSLFSSVGEPVYYGGRNRLEWLSLVPYPLKKTTQQIDIPTPSDVEQATAIQLGSLSFPDRVTSLKKNAVISKNTWYTGNFKPSGSLTVNAGTWLVIEGDLEMKTPFLGSLDLNLWGNIVVKGGSVKFGKFDILNLGAMNLRGNGMIICVQGGGVEIRQIGAEFLGLSVITSGQVKLESLGAASGSFLAYGDSVSVSASLFGLNLSTCCLVSNTDVAISSTFALGTSLAKGAKEQWSNQPILTGLGTTNGYSIVSWKEGNE